MTRVSLRDGYPRPLWPSDTDYREWPLLSHATAEGIR